MARFCPDRLVDGGILKAGHLCCGQWVLSREPEGRLLRLEVQPPEPSLPTSDQVEVGRCRQQLAEVLARPSRAAVEIK